MRGTAVGIFLSGSVIGPALGTPYQPRMDMFSNALRQPEITSSGLDLGPCIGGIVVTYASWRTIYWMQTGMAGVGLAFALWVVRGIHDPLGRGDQGQRSRNDSNTRTAFLGTLLSRFNPLGPLRFLLLPNILLAVSIHLRSEFCALVEETDTTGYPIDPCMLHPCRLPILSLDDHPFNY